MKPQKLALGVMALTSLLLQASRLCAADMPLSKQRPGSSRMETRERIVRPVSRCPGPVYTCFSLYGAYGPWGGGSYWDRYTARYRIY